MKNRWFIFGVTIVFFTLIALIGIFNVFNHGFYCDRVEYEEIEAEDFVRYVNLKNEEFKQIFVPRQNYFKGFEINLVNLPDENSGNVIFTIYDLENRIIERCLVDVETLKPGVWHPIYLQESLKKNEQYSLVISADECQTYPYLQIVNPNNLTKENVEGDLLLGYAYGMPTFSLLERALIVLLLLSIWLLIYGQATTKVNVSKLCLTAGFFILLTSILTWNYMFNTMNDKNEEYNEFQATSESLVLDMMRAVDDEKEITVYGLGVYENDSVRGYKSQYGLQGKIFTFVTEICGYDDDLVTALHSVCSFAAASVFVVIVFLISKKYNMLMGGVFFITFWLSPWIVNFARNLYWVEFTWFIPMVIGLICSIYIEKRIYRICSYVGAFLAILVRSLCGYEYITNIMLGLIVFLLVDFVNAVCEKDKKRSIKIFCTITLIGMCALIGFFTAMVLHGHIRGEGNIVVGLKSIFQNDVLKRVHGGEMGNFPEILWPSLNASTWETFILYCHFPGEIITGIPGNIFLLLCMCPILIFIYNWKKKDVLSLEDITLYIFFFITSVSWLVLAKAHSFIHTHMNYVMWYFGYIQICIYIISKQFFYKGRKK